MQVVVAIVCPLLTIYPPIAQRFLKGLLVADRYLAGQLLSVLEPHAMRMTVVGFQPNPPAFL
ncbi:MAG TPA: hypothetical protein VFT53_05085 [Candidatus Saccharimonadales bacterium]|nr:hypothetical protein [Candidatus Saccharimonadales bacterium]